jgi:membrane glycosyltransferase
MEKRGLGRVETAWQLARDRVLLYLRASNLPPFKAMEMGLEALKRTGPSEIPTAIKTLRTLLIEEGLDKGILDAEGDYISSMPPMNRGVMIPEDLSDKASKPVSQGPWIRSARLRRIILILLIVFPTILTCNYMANVLPNRGATLLETALVAVFGILFAWISIGFWTALMGLIAMLFNYHRYSPPREYSRHAEESNSPLPRTAVLIPIFGEDVDRVMAGIRTVYRSVSELGYKDRFDFFILSDSTDPDKWVEEEVAWFHLCRDEDAFGRIYYRKRRSNTKRKSGNVADFCRRWGKNYPFMIVFDADSIMAASTMAKMVRIMEARPDIGILQTLPAAVNRHSLIGRVQQFINHVYGPMFAAGVHFWLLGDAQYWGHNAIIRTEAFMRHCALPRLTGRGPLAGDILSHDFVESALMRRAGYGVWLAYELDGSFEETPPTLLDELKRERRWCQGNLQHLRLIFSRGLFPVHRALFVNGVMSYGSALLWLLFLVLSSTEAILETLHIPSYFTGTKSLFPSWPVWYPHWVIALLASTAGVLFLPKILSVLLITRKRLEGLYGGRMRLVLSVLMETVLSTLFAPIRMLFHSRFVMETLLGKRTGWLPQSRKDEGTSWGTAMRFHWVGMLIGVLWGIVLDFFNPSFFLWMTPVIIPIALSGVISALTSKTSLGEMLRRKGLLLTPEETDPPKELRELERNLKLPAPYSPFPISRKKGFLRAVVDPFVHALHTSLQLTYRGGRSKPAKAEFQELLKRALEQGPESLTKEEQIRLLRRPEELKALHYAVWELPDRERAAKWMLTFPSVD